LRVDQLADQGFRGVTISYDVWPDQLDVIVSESKRRGMATLRHRRHQCSTRFGQLCPEICNPAGAMEATADALDVPNPWSAPSAAVIKAADLDNPIDRSTGESAFLASLNAERRKRIRDCAWHKQAFDARLYQLRAKYLAGSSATSYGIMPGSGLYLELTLLHRIGLSSREAIAAATSNFADIYGWSDIGRIEPGRAADVLILNADPRSDLAALEHIDRIVFRGAGLDRKSLLEAR
jgi:Amidohydrolase family